MSREILAERDYPHPPERVWRAITDSKALAEWLMPNNFLPKVGHKFRFDVGKPQWGWRGFVEGEVLEADAPRRLSYTWCGDEKHPPTIVTWTLEPIAAGTRLRLQHGKFYGFGGFMAKFFMGKGWGKKLVTKIPALLDRFKAEEQAAAPGREGGGLAEARR